MAALAIPSQAIRHLRRAGRSRALIAAVNIALILLLAWIAARATWTFLAGEPGPADPGEAAMPAPAPVQRAPRYNPAQIAAFHLFGEASKVEQVEVQVPVDAPDTSLQLTLSGVLASDDPKEARAIVADARREEKHYALGDPLPGGAKLREIHPDRIILERAGRFETLRLPKDDGPGGRGVSVVSYSPPDDSGVPVDYTDDMSASDVDRSEALQRYREEIASQPATFMNYVRATPAREDGRFVGFRLQPGREPGVLDQLGLRPGDVVTSINGVQIDNPAKGMQAMRELGDGEDINVTLLRDGEEMSLNFQLPASGQ